MTIPASKPRVAVVYHFFAHYRGAVNRALLASEEYDFYFVGALTDPNHEGIKEWVCPDPSRFIPTRCRYVRSWMVQSGLVRLALRREISALIFLGDHSFLSTWLGAWLARLSGKRVYFWGHGWKGNDGPKADRLRTLLFRLGHGLMLYGNTARQFAIERGFAPETVHVIYNSLDYPAQKAEREQVTPAELAQMRASLFDHPERPLLICTGRLIPERKLDLLLEAMRLLNAEGREVNLLLVGAGPAQAALAETAQRDGLAVHFYGACYDEAILSRLVMAADLTVTPGRLGLTAMHSLAYGTPIIASGGAAGQMPEWESVIPGFNGGHFRADDSRDLARAIREWLEHAPPRDLLRERCYAVIERFYNPDYQRLAIERALAGVPASDDEWRAFLAETARSMQMAEVTV